MSAAASMVFTGASDLLSRTPSIVKNKQSMSVDGISAAGFKKLQAHSKSSLEGLRKAWLLLPRCFDWAINCPDPTCLARDSGTTAATEGFDDQNAQLHDLYDPIEQ
jgi:hypothetical protein